MPDTSLEAGGAWLPDTMDIIQDAMNLDSEAFAGIPAQEWLKPALLVIWGHGFCDDQAGSTDTIGHVFRVGRHVLETDSQGFTDVHSYGTEDAAQELIDFVNERMYHFDCDEDDQAVHGCGEGD